MCNCKCRRGSSGWLAFWLLVILLVIAAAQGKAEQKQVLTPVEEVSVKIEVPDQEPRSVSRIPSVNEDEAMELMLRQMEEEGRRMPKI